MKRTSSPLNKQSRILLAVVTGILVCLLGISWSCKNAESPTSPPNNGNGIEEFLGAGTPGAPVSDDQRSAALDTVMQHFASVFDLDVASANQSLAKHFRTMTAFDAAGASDDGSVWAHFTDGRVLVVANNRPLGTAGGEAYMKNVVSRDKNPDELPFDNRVRLLRALGTWFPDVTPSLKSMFTANGYVISGQDASVDGLEKVNGDAVVHFDTHGGEGKLLKLVDGKLEWDGNAFSLMTSTPVTTANNAKYLSELKNHQLTYFIAKHDTDAQGKPTLTKNYGITSRFIKAFMTFGEHSIVFLNACSSFNEAFSTACTGNNASVYVGWTRPVASNNSNHTCLFLFSRLLGAIPGVDPENPPQRPFDLELVKKDMFDRKLDRYRDYTYTGPNVAYTELHFAPEFAEFTLLAPSIQEVDVNEADGKLTLYGSFGKNPGTSDGVVTVDGVALVVDHWEQTVITCYIPNLGSGSAGDVIVKVRDHKSNTVQLTEWRGTVTYNQPSIGSLGSFYSFNLHFRADVHSFREKPSEEPHPIIEAATNFMKDSHGEFSPGGTASGSCTVGCLFDMTETWIPTQIGLPYVPDGIPPAAGFVGNVRIMPKAKSAKLFLLGFVNSGFTSHFILNVVCPDETRRSETDLPLPNGTVVPPLGYVSMDIDDAFVIKSGSVDVSSTSIGVVLAYKLTYCGTPPEPVTATISWSNFQPKFLPKDDAAR